MKKYYFQILEKKPNSLVSIFESEIHLFDLLNFIENDFFQAKTIFRIQFYLKMKPSGNETIL